MIIPKAIKQMAVTNADDEFQFMVPASAGALQASVTYTGYATADNSTVNLANAQVVVVERKQELKYYLKTARKEVKRSLKKVRA